MWTGQKGRLLNLVRVWVLGTLVLGTVLLFPSPARCKPTGFQGPLSLIQEEDVISGDMTKAWVGLDPMGDEEAGTRLALREKGAPGRGWDFEDAMRLVQPMPRGAREEFDQNRRAWESLNPERKEKLRQRMERFRDLSPEERDLYRQRYQQWQSLSPKERERIRQNLDRWNDLSPEEKDKMRRRFR